MSSSSLEIDSETRTAGQKIVEFVNQYDTAYLSLACHAAFPLVLTPDLLYQIWAEFVEEAPWISVAHLLLSPLCQEVSYEVVEMPLSVRNLLLTELVAQKGKERLTELGYFMLSYIGQCLQGSDADTENLRERQTLTALAYTQPTEAARRLAQKLSAGVKTDDVREAFRWTTMAKTLATPLKEAGFEPLLTYNDLIFHYAQGNQEEYQALNEQFGRDKGELESDLGINVLQTPVQENQLALNFQPLLTRVGKIKVEQGIPLQTLEFKTPTVDRRGRTIKRETHTVEYFAEKVLDNTDINMIYIPEGEFWMGSLGNEGNNGEKPQHYVKVAPFYMSQTPITQAQWKAVCEAEIDSEMDLALNPDPSSFKEPYGEGEKAIERWQRPVENVSWYDAIKFCARLSILTGRNYRLPSEAQWEYGCRCAPRQKAKGKRQKEGDDVGAQGLRPPQGLSPDDLELTLEDWNNNYYQPFHFGETLTSGLANYAASETYADEAKGEYRQQTTPVSLFPPNAFGLYDMHGNVWEWCLDPWHDNYEDAPSDGSVWDENNNDNRYQNILNNINELLKDNRNRRCRGGCWVFNPVLCRSAYRDSSDPRVDDSNRGVRVVCGDRT